MNLKEILDELERAKYYLDKSEDRIVKVIYEIGFHEYNESLVKKLMPYFEEATDYIERAMDNIAWVNDGVVSAMVKASLSLNSSFDIKWAKDTLNRAINYILNAMGHVNNAISTIKDNKELTNILNDANDLLTHAQYHIDKLIKSIGSEIK